MAEYQAPLEDMRFLLFDVFSAEDLWNDISPDLSSDLASAVLEEAAKFIESEIFPKNLPGHEQGCSWENGKVATPKGFREAFRGFAENGWCALGGEEEYGGQGLPKMLIVLFEEMMFSANASFALFPVLSNGAAMALNAHGSQSQKEKVLPKFYTGEWCGTMCLTEAHSGTDLGMIRTKAVPEADGSYLVTGTKIFITSGEHDLTDNIVHLVLAKLPDAPEGTSGISLFLVSKYKLDAEGELVIENGEPVMNGVECASIEHKMGLNGSPTCVLNFEGARGELVGEINHGLAHMFTMMNYERLSMGIQGVGLASVAFQNSLAYAQERLQGRASSGIKNPDGPADAIIHHADVRRMLVSQQCWLEAGRALAVYIGAQLDKGHNGDGQSQKLASLLTPVAKAFLSDKGFESCVSGQQVYGGHGYIREWGMEQLVRDARIAQIYEGTNGVQAIDLISRKVFRDKGETASGYFQSVEATAEKLSGVNPVFATNLLQSLQDIRQCTDFILKEAGQRAELLNAVAVDYLEMFGIVSCAHMWSMMMPECKAGDGPFYAEKIKTGAYFFQKCISKTGFLKSSILAGEEAYNDLYI